MGIFRKRGPLFDSTATPATGDTFQIQGRQIVCPHCGNSRFDLASALLNTPGMTFFGLDWANRTASVLCCRQCGRIEWFLRPPETIA